MKRLILLIFVIPLLSHAQTDTLQNVIDRYVVDGKSITYVQVYDLPGMSQDQVKQAVIKYGTTNPKVSVVQASISTDQIEGSFSNFTVDYRKYGFKWAGMGIWVLHPATGAFTIQFKDNKYRVIVKGVRFNVGSSMVFDFNNDFVNRDGGLNSVNNGSFRRAYYSFGKNMEELFTLNETKNSDW